jgi:hypothetical protein
VLARWGWLCVHNREVEILDLPGLTQFALNTRRGVDDGPHAPGPQADLRRYAS